MEEALEEARLEMEASVEHLAMEYAGLRTGRASVHLLDNIRVSYYGSEVPLNQLASIATPDPTLLVIAPFDPTSIADIEKAIHRSGLGLSPTSDGRVVRLPVPPLTEERRVELAKLVSKMAEDDKTSVRNHRRAANEKIKEAEKGKEISEDDEHRLLKEAQKLTDEFIEKIDELAEKKKQEILQI